MITETSDKEAIIAAIDGIVAELQQELKAIGNEKVNSVPFPGSWTAAQVFDHITKSTNWVAYVMATEAGNADRDPLERVGEIKEIFLNFTRKLQSPDLIIPGKGPYETTAVSTALQSSFEKFRENASRAELEGLVTGFPLGPITKWELLHFVVYHTQRHLHQMKSIRKALEK